MQAILDYSQFLNVLVYCIVLDSNHQKRTAKEKQDIYIFTVSNKTGKNRLDLLTRQLLLRDEKNNVRG